MNHLPTTLFITGVKIDAAATPVAGGSFADVYRGAYQGRDVAIKRIRVFLSNDDTNKLYKVCYMSEQATDTFADEQS
jgi:predicted unusual protein kinase regulating ubiquinone biosynthesis (AarF/ABC1/UbiB family)